MYTHGMETRKSTLDILLLSIFLFSSEIGAQIQLFNGANYSSLIVEIHPTDNCVNLPSDKIGLVHSVITSTCFIAYNGDNCKAAWSRKYDPGKTSHNDYIYAKSVQTCNDEEGGHSLNVDITKYFHKRDQPYVPNIIESYQGVCACINLPNNVQNMKKWSINNHHNRLYAYFEANCTEKHSKALYIEPGHNPTSRDMHTHQKSYRGKTLKIRSFGPDPNTTQFQQTCSAYPNDQIMKLELLEPSTHINARYADVILKRPPPPTNLTTGANDDLMHFFSDYGYNGFHFGSRSTSKCNTFSKPVERHWVNGVRSMQTKTCVMLYLNGDCNGRSVKIDSPGTNNLTNVWESTVTGDRTLSLFYTQFPNWKWETKSYHVCNKDKGGPQLNVDIVSSDPKVDPINGPVILEEYRDMCSCRNVPEYVQQLWMWSIDNYGNELMAYFTPNCLESNLSPLRVPGGQSSYSFGLGFFEKDDKATGVTHKIQSFGPDLNSDYYVKNCNKNFTELNFKNFDDFETKTKSERIALLNAERMFTLEEKLEKLIEEFGTLLKKVDELKPIYD